MINLPLKVLIGLGVAGAIGGGGYGIYTALKPEATIRDVLKERNLALLSTDSEWDEKVNKFGASSPSTDKLEGFEKNTEDNKQEENRKAMKDACDNLLSTPLSKETADIKTQITNWCTKAKSGG